MTSPDKWVGGFVASHRPVTNWTGDPYRDLGIIHVFAATAVERGMRVFNVAVDGGVLLISPATRPSGTNIEVSVQYDAKTFAPSLAVQLSVFKPSGWVSEVSPAPWRYAGDVAIELLYAERLRALG